MNSNREVSIALCTYNGARFLEEQLESVLGQDYPFITEIVCLDDNSTDATWAILKSYAEKYPIFKIERNEQNLGFTKNFEKAFGLTTKPLVAVCDQDDVWVKDKISKLVNALCDNLMAYSDNEYIDEEGQSLNKNFSDYRRLTTITSCLNFTLFNGISGHTLLFDRKLLTYTLPFRMDVPYDFWLAFHAAQYGIIPYVAEPLVKYRQHSNNVIGGMGHDGDRVIQSKKERIEETGKRINIFAQYVAPHLKRERWVLRELGKSYDDRSVVMRLKRFWIFLIYGDDIQLLKRKSKFMKKLYCFKAVWKYL
jgi:glycosyltransferase involved in cell wall biosynthesis